MLFGRLVLLLLLLVLLILFQILVSILLLLCRSAPADRPSGFLGAALPISFAGRVDLPPAEMLGASTDSVLRELAGCNDDDLSRLRTDGVIA